MKAGVAQMIKAVDKRGTTELDVSGSEIGLYVLKNDFIIDFPSVIDQVFTLHGYEIVTFGCLSGIVQPVTKQMPNV